MHDQFPAAGVALVLGFLLIFLVVAITPFIFYLITLQKTLNKCSPATRTMEPGLVWLTLIPIVHFVFHFFVVLGIHDSLKNEYARRGVRPPDLESGKGIGIAMCVCGCCVIIPILGYLATLAHLVLWIIYWIKVAEYSRMLDSIPDPMLQQAPPPLPQYYPPATY